MDCTVTSDASPGLLAVLADAGLAPSRSAARKLLQGGGVSVNGVVQAHPEAEFDWGQALFGRYFLIRRGKKNWHLLARDKHP